MGSIYNQAWAAKKNSTFDLTPNIVLALIVDIPIGVRFLMYDFDVVVVIKS